MDLISIIKKPVVTEKSAHLSSQNQYAFFVHPSANKIEVAKAIKLVYGVTPKSVQIMNTQIKKTGQGRLKRKVRRKAIVSLKKGDTLEPSKLA